MMSMKGRVIVNLKHRWVEFLGDLDADSVSLKQLQNSCHWPLKIETGANIPPIEWYPQQVCAKISWPSCAKFEQARKSDVVSAWLVTLAVR